MTIAIRDREKAIAYHEALAQYSSAFLKSLRSGCDMSEINQCTLPINVSSPALIAQYTRAVEKLSGPTQRAADLPIGCNCTMNPQKDTIHYASCPAHPANR
jgi:hypothetical protein